MNGIRLMTLDDLPKVIAIENEVQLHPWPIEAFKQALRIKHYCIVLEEDGEIIGYGVANLEAGHGRNVACKVPMAANKLFMDWFTRSKDLKLKRLRVEVDVENTASKARLERYGFTSIGVRPNFYGTGRNAEVYVKRLDS